MRPKISPAKPCTASAFQSFHSSRCTPCLGLMRTLSAPFHFYFSINQCPSSLNSFTSLPRIRQMYRIPNPPAFKDAARRTSSIRSISNTRPSSQVMARGRMFPSKSKSALTCKLIFIIIASLYYELLFVFIVAQSSEKEKRTK